MAENPIQVDLPASAQMLSARWPRVFGRAMMRMIGWRLTGSVPDRPKILFVVAPHTSNWDWVIGMCALLGVGFKITYLAKHSLFFWPLGNLIRATGGEPIVRSAPADAVDRLVEQFESHQALYYGLAPEGTRSKVERWKTGFLRVAARTEVVLVLVSFDYAQKEIHIGQEFQPSGDTDQDIQQVMNYFRQFEGRNPNLQS